MFKQLFCSHNYKVISEHTETYTEPITTTTGGREFNYRGVLTDFWGQPMTRTRTDKTVILSCDKCGKTKTEVL